jgi:hypothetical protein
MDRMLILRFSENSDSNFISNCYLKL